MMRISNKQRAIINSAVKPLKITSNYLGPGLQNLIKYYTKYFTKRRFSIVHHLPAYKNSKYNYILTVLFNAYVQKGGFAKKRHPHTWRFYGNTLLTKYGRKEQHKELKKKRKKVRRQKKKTTSKNVRSTEMHANGGESTGTNSNQTNKSDEDNDSNDSDVIEIISTPPKAQTNCTITENDSNDKTKATTNSSDATKIWGLGLQKISNHFTDENEIIESTNDNEDEPNEVKQSTVDKIVHDSEQINCVDEESQGQSSKSSGGDINEKLRQQLKLLKMGKSDNSLFAPKESRPLNIRSKNSSFRRSNSNLSIESGTNTNTNSRRSVNDVGTSKSTNNSLECSPKSAADDDTNKNAKSTSHEENNEANKSPKAIGGMIDSLFNKFQSILPKRSSKLRSTQSPTMSSAVPAKRMKRDDTVESLLYASLDSNLDDSNQSETSMSMEFLGFDISNKNVDVSALLPTPKVPSSSNNHSAAFFSESLDTFMKENLLEKSNDQLPFAPIRCSRDEALMTFDAQPPSLSVPERPNDMQRPRTLAEKRMILQQQNDISILIIENESTVYHELKKRVRQGPSYDSTMIRSIQNTSIPFTRDCWRAACWISTSNNRFFYRTVLFDGEEIKLAGSRGDNPNKLAIDIKPNELSSTNRRLSYIWNECPKKCPAIDDIKINNIEVIVNDKENANGNTEDASQTKEKLALLKKSRLCMFSREYLTPGPKCKKVKCKSNRKTSFDLEYGPLELVQLPMVQLEVWPQVGLSLSDHIKPLLKTIPTNSNVITPEWAKFAASVVREPPKQKKHRRKYKKPDTEPPESIVFNIPYENNERKILIRRRRRSSIVFNKNDTVNEHIESFYRENDDDDYLSFKKHVDPNDKLSVECADILTNMIDSIAIAVNDTNFIKQDPDIDYVGRVEPVCASKESTKTTFKTEKDKNTKSEKTSKNKLIKELRRLNVTVIDTANEMSTSKKTDELCQKSFCKLGCVCGSIDTAKYIQIHCQRPECMFECVCVNSPFKEGNPFYLNNSFDALQARANACLAKEEKEFKSTIIVSENDMFVLPNTSTATKRSSKKPKRFTNDETYLEDTETETIFKSKRRRPEEKVTVIEPRPTPNKHRYNLIKSLQHVRVELKSLPELGVEPWCLVHCLYKCHCKGRAQKGRIFNFANKKNDLIGPGGWEMITPRKRQYTFERENGVGSGDEPLQKISKIVTPDVVPKIITPESQPVISTIPLAARTRVFDWRKRPRRTQQELIKLRNECNFAENTDVVSLLHQRIMRCRKYNQAQNMLAKSMEHGRLAAKLTNGHSTTTNKSLQHMNQVITETMHRLTSLQERNRLSLNHNPNKLSIVPWNQILLAFKSHQIFIWDIELKNNLRLLALTTTHVTPKDEKLIRVTNISYTEDVNSLPMVAKMLRNEYQSDRTKYLSMLLLRLTHFWRICGVLHSDLKYMDDEIRSKPTPDQNPKLSQKINNLYRLLTTREIQNARPLTDDKVVGNSSNESIDLQESSNQCDSTSSPLSSSEPQNVAGEQTESLETPRSKVKRYFENTSMGLTLPLPCRLTQRLLMINLGDDFTHLWFHNWHDFLSMKKIQHCLQESKRLKIPIELSSKKNLPRVFVVNTHESRIFIGPYEHNDRQNVALFIKHENHMVLHENYYKRYPENYTKKTKASWIYPTTHENGNVVPKKYDYSKKSHLKIDQVFSKNDMPPELISDSKRNDDDENASTSSNQSVRSGYFTLATTSNGVKVVPASTSDTIVATRVSSKVFVPTKVVELTSTRLENNSKQEPLQLKISSVASGEEVTLMTNGFSDIDDLNMQPKISSVKSLAKQDDLENLDDDLLEKVPSECGSKPESIDISDDEQPSDMINRLEKDMNSIPTKAISPNEFGLLKGYMYCMTNNHLGKVNIEWTAPGRIKLHLTDPIEIDCIETETYQENLATVSNYMSTYIRDRFYAVYPAHLRLEWIFIKLNDDEQCTSPLCDLNQTEAFSVVFKDKIVEINSNYRDDPKLSTKDKYVLDIYYLASQLFKQDEVKTMKITDIIKRSQLIDAQLDEQQIKLKKYQAHYKKTVDRFTTIFTKQVDKQPQSGTA
ncbi:uncharacterized protein LOC116345684 [Contarinia nasturtii]|uniref:uncharacterized protein LOC116345684 n=1 Tax=Contarinia nasturtii TaxID=265458 RepID=UPI0012D41538|nr:uncharacterized protein LOC116345684 [Contarinia nasturtii]XP_031631145.1 uncharacterized protein LOC116345684 [Contarinia nasturtii]